VAFQLDEGCGAMSEADILTTLSNFPKDLVETYQRILLRIQRSKSGTCKLSTAQKIFTWIICARRPLSIDELKEAIIFTPEDNFLDGKKVPINQSQLLHACGNLVLFDQEDCTVLLAHYKAQQSLLSAHF
jgi:hypothetical protein